MDTDVLFVGGFVLLILAFPAFVSAFTHGHRPRIALLLAATGGGLLGYVLYTRPSTYTLEDLPAVALRVAGRLLN